MINAAPIDELKKRVQRLDERTFWFFVLLVVEVGLLSFGIIVLVWSLFSAAVAEQGFPLLAIGGILSLWLALLVTFLHRALREKYRPEARALRQALVVDPHDKETLASASDAIIEYYRVSAPFLVGSRRGGHLLGVMLGMLCIVSSLAVLVFVRT